MAAGVQENEVNIARQRKIRPSDFKRVSPGDGPKTKLESLCPAWLQLAEAMNLSVDNREKIARLVSQLNIMLNESEKAPTLDEVEAQCKVKELEMTIHHQLNFASKKILTNAANEWYSSLDNRLL